MTDLFDIITPLPLPQSSTVAEFAQAVIDDLQLRQTMADLGLLNLGAGLDTQLHVVRICAAAAPAIERLHRLSQHRIGRFAIEAAREHDHNALGSVARLLSEEGFDYQGGAR